MTYLTQSELALMFHRARVEAEEKQLRQIHTELIEQLEKNRKK